MNDPRTPHEGHDPLRVAAFAAGDLDGEDRDAVAALLASCLSCAVLDRDLRALAGAVHDLPPAVRTRDYTLTPEVVARLRRPLWRRVVAAFAGERLQLARPIGAAMASLGLAGLLVSTLPGTVPLAGVGAAASSQPYLNAAPSAATRDQMDTSGAEGAQGGQGGAPESVAPFEVQQQVRETGGGSDADDSVPDAALATRAADTTLAVLSGTFLIVGLGLFGLRWTANRLDDG